MLKENHRRERQIHRSRELRGRGDRCKRVDARPAKERARRQRLPGRAFEDLEHIRGKGGIIGRWRRDGGSGRRGWLNLLEER